MLVERLTSAVCFSVASAAKVTKLRDAKRSESMMSNYSVHAKQSCNEFTKNEFFNDWTQKRKQ